MTGYHPEMGEQAPADTLIFADLSHYGKHWFIRVHPSIPRLTGRGVEFMETGTAESLVPGSKFVGWSRYKVTQKAFERIDATYKTATEMLL